MAAQFPSASNVRLRPRKGHDMTWSCVKHDEPICFYCKEHKIPICHKCATKDHVKKPCELDDIEDVILTFGKALEAKLLELAETTKHLKKINSEIQSCSAFVSDHLETVNNVVNIAYKDKIKTVKDKVRDEILRINEEADEEIRIINEKRERRVKSCGSEEEKQQQIIQDTRTKLLSDTKKINVTVGKKIEDLTIKNQHKIDTMNIISRQIKRIKQEDKTLVNEAPQVMASLRETVQMNANQDILDCLDQLKREVQRVKFVKGKMGREDFVRHDGYIGKWERDSGSLDGWITVYDRQWKVVRDITIPRNTQISNTVYVDVDNDGMILAGQLNQSNIYVINPTDGKIVHTITMQSKEMRGPIQALSSGDIVVKTDVKEFTVISRSGGYKTTLQCDDWSDTRCCVDTLYITYDDDDRGIYAVDLVSRDGNIQARSSVEYKDSDRPRYSSPCLITPSGNLITCNENKIFVYKKIVDA